MDARTSVLFPFSTRNSFFGQIWSKKIKIVSLGWNLVPRLTRVCRIQWRCSLFCFKPETLFLGKFGPKNENCQFKLKFGTKTNSNMQNSMVVFTFSVLYWKHPFLMKEEKRNVIIVPATLPEQRLWNWQIYQHSFLFCWGLCVRGLIFDTDLKS